MEIKMDADSLAAIASAAIFDSMAQDQRDSVIKQAIQHLLTPEENRGRYGPGTTPLQKAFDQSIETAAYRVVQEKIANDPQVTKYIEELLSPMVISAISAEAEFYDSSLADAVGKAVGTWLGEQARKRREST